MLALHPGLPHHLRQHPANLAQVSKRAILHKTSAKTRRFDMQRLKISVTLTHWKDSKKCRTRTGRKARPGTIPSIIWAVIPAIIPGPATSRSTLHTISPQLAQAGPPQYEALKISVTSTTWKNSDNFDTLQSPASRLRPGVRLGLRLDLQPGRRNLCPKFP